MRFAGFSSIDRETVIPAIAEDGSLFPVGKLEAHRKGQQHLAVSVFVFAGDKLLVQQRADGKYHCGGLWANTCCTHPHWGETTQDCAGRRLFEELGLTLALEPCAIVDYCAHVGNGLIENERVHTFRGDVAAPFELTDFNRDEVQCVTWVGHRALRHQVAANPELFTPWIRIYLDRWHELAMHPAA